MAYIRNNLYPVDDFTKGAIIDYFRRKKIVWNEEYFISMLENSPSRHDVYFATIALRDCGSERCIPALKAKLHYKMQDVKCTAILTIAHIAGEKETDLYAQCLLDPEYRQPAYAIWAIKDAGDERAISAVLGYFHKNRGKIRSGKLLNGTIADGLEYLQKFRTANEEVEKLFTFIKENWEALPLGERNEIGKRIPNF